MKLLLFYLLHIVFISFINARKTLRRSLLSEDIQYIVKYEKTTDLSTLNLNPHKTHCFIHFCTSTIWISPTIASTLYHQHGILSIIKDEYVHSDKLGDRNGYDLTPYWHLDRIDQLQLPLNNVYDPKYTGKGSTIWILDDGTRTSHEEFSGRMYHGWNFITNKQDTSPILPSGYHGVHVASILIGKNVGVASDANAIMLKTLDDDGIGTISDIIDGFSYIYDHVNETSRIISYSIGSTFSATTEIIQDVIEDLVESKDIIMVVSAGNDNKSACNYVPARSNKVITVGAINKNDEKAFFTNHGSCVDVYAPGIEISGADITSDVAIRSLSGTSMATPMVSGIIAQIMEKYNHTLNTNQVMEILQTQSTLIQDSIPFYFVETSNRTINPHEFNRTNQMNHQNDSSHRKHWKNSYIIIIIAPSVIILTLAILMI